MTKRIPPTMKPTCSISFTLVLVIFLLSASDPAFASNESSSVQNILNSYRDSLGPVRFVCGTGLRLNNRIRQPSPILVGTADKLFGLGLGAVPCLTENLDNEDSRIVELASLALSRFGSDAVPGIVSKLETMRVTEGSQMAEKAAHLIQIDSPQGRLFALTNLLNTTGVGQSLCWSTASELARKSVSKNLSAPSDPEGDLLARYALHFTAGLQNRDLRQASAYMLNRCAYRIRSKEVSYKVANALAKTIGTRGGEYCDFKATETISHLHFVPPAVMTQLNHLTNSSDHQISEGSASAVVFLAQGDPNRSFDGVLKLLSSPDREKRFRALGQLRLLNSRQSVAVPYLIKMGNDPRAQTPRDLILLAGTLRHYGEHSAPAVPLLTRLLKNSDRDVQVAACKALGDIGEPAKVALPHLLNLGKTTKDRRVYDEATRAIKRIS